MSEMREKIAEAKSEATIAAFNSFRQEIGWRGEEIADLRALVCLLIEKLGGSCSVSKRDFHYMRESKQVFFSRDDERNRSVVLWVDK
ncbi:MAG: hypothetical protein CMK32_08015 [Porticoccaceae bacterium]|nr:hypothetical protein [Porticoccaceae bacterium]